MKIPMALFTALLVWCLSVSSFGQISPDYDALVQQGKTQLQSGNNDAALASANAAIKMSADRWEAYAVAGGALMNLKRYEEATDDFSNAIDHAPGAKQTGLRDLRKQCLLAESGATPVRSEAVTPSAKSGTSSDPSYAETVKWIQAHIGEAGFPASSRSDSRSGLVFRWDDAAYSIQFDGCVMQLAMAEHWHTTDTKPVNSTDQTETDSHMNITFHLPLDKIFFDQKPLMLAPQSWELADIDGSFYVSKAIPTVAIVLPNNGTGTTSYDWNTNDETVTPQSNSWSSRPIVNGAFVTTINSVFGGQIPAQGIQISYARPGTEDSPEHMVKALQHLVDLCHQNPNAAPKDIF